MSDCPQEALPLRTYQKFDQILRIGKAAVRNAQEESRRMGVPNVYSINGITYYEWPDGELRREDPWQGRDTKPGT